MRTQAECLALLEALTTDYSNFLAAAAIPPGSPLHLAYVLMGIGSSSGSSASAADIGDAVDDALRASPLIVSSTVALHSISRYRNTALSATKQEIKATAGDVYGWNLINTNTVDVFVKFYNGAAAAVTVGTTAPVLTLLVPAGNSAGAGLFFQEVGEQPQERFADGITVACVTGIADNSTATPSIPIHASVRFI